MAVKRARLPAFAGKTWLDALLAYTRLYSPVRRSARARLTQRLPWGDEQRWTARRNRSWAALRQHAAELVAGEHADPCRQAMDWGGSMDEPGSRHVKVRCGKTANTFYRVLANRR